MLFYGSENIEMARRIVSGAHYRIQHFNITAKTDGSVTMTYINLRTKIECLEKVPETCSGEISNEQVDKKYAETKGWVAQMVNYHVVKITCATCKCDFRVDGTLCQKPDFPNPLERGKSCQTKVLSSICMCKRHRQDEHWRRAHLAHLSSRKMFLSYT